MTWLDGFYALGLLFMAIIMVMPAVDNIKINGQRG